MSLQITSASAQGGDAVWGGISSFEDCSSLSLSHFCHPLLPPLFKIYFSFKTFFSWCVVPIQEHLEKVVKWEKRVICFLSSSIFSCVYVFPLTSANSVKMEGRKNK